MASTLPSTLIPRIIGESRKALRETFALATCVNIDGASRNGNSGLLEGKIGQSVDAAIPAALSAADVTVGQTVPNPSSITVGATQVTLSHFRKADFSLTGRQGSEYDLQSLFVEQVAEATRAVIKDLNEDLQLMYKKVPNLPVGSAGTGFFASNPDGLADAHEELTTNLCPQANRKAVWSLADMAAFLKLDQLQKANERGDQSVTNDAIVGRYLGFEHLQDQQVQSHTTGTITSTPTVGSAGAAAGATSIPVDCATGEDLDLNVGDLITFSEDTTKAYAVAADVAVTAGNSGTITIYHGLADAITSSSDVAIATGHGSGAVNLAGDFSGITLVNRLPARDSMGTAHMGTYLPMVDPETGIALALVGYGLYHQAQWEVVGLWGEDVTDPRRLVRCYGA